MKGRPPIKDLEKYRSNVTLVMCLQLMVVRIVEARDNLEAMAPDAKNLCDESRPLQEMQSKNWFKTLTQRMMQSFKKGMGTQCVEIGDRDERCRRWVGQRSEERKEMVDHGWCFPDSAW